LLFTEPTRIFSGLFPLQYDSAINGKENVTVSGKYEPIETVLQMLKKEGINGKLVPVSHAFHCSLIDSILPEFKNMLERIDFNPPSIKIISGFKGQFLTKNVDFPTYFHDQTRGTVQFLNAVSTMDTNNVLEIGATPSLTPFCRQISSDRKWLFSQVQGVGADRQIANATAYLYSVGKNIDFSWLESPDWKPETLPFTCFQRKLHVPQIPAEIVLTDTGEDKKSHEPKKNSGFLESELDQKEAYLNRKEKELMKKIKLMDMQHRIFHELCSNQRKILAKNLGVEN